MYPQFRLGSGEKLQFRGPDGSYEPSAVPAAVEVNLQLYLKTGGRKLFPSLPAAASANRGTSRVSKSKKQNGVLSMQHDQSWRSGVV